MKTTLPPLLLCCLLLAGPAGAAPSPAPVQPPQAPPGRCVQALEQQRQQDQQHRQAQLPRKKVNPDAMYDPCRLSDGTPNHDIGNNEGESVQDLYNKLDEWVEWNRRVAGNNDAALWLWSSSEESVRAQHGSGPGEDGWSSWRLTDRYNGERQQLWLEPASAAPAVPEPASVLSWAAGLTLLAALRWRRRVLSGDTAQPAARQ